MFLVYIFLTTMVQVLDEIYRVLKFVRASPNPPRAHELLQELRDISSMAMEHFDEKIVPSLRERKPETSMENGSSGSLNEAEKLCRSLGVSGGICSTSWTWNSTSAMFQFKGRHQRLQFVRPQCLRAVYDSLGLRHLHLLLCSVYPQLPAWVDCKTGRTLNCICLLCVHVTCVSACPCSKRKIA